MAKKKSEYSIRVRGRNLHVRVNSLEHLLPNESMHAIVEAAYDKNSGKCAARVSGEIAREVFRDFLDLAFDDLIEKRSTFVFPVSKMALRIEDTKDSRRQQIRRPHQQYFFAGEHRARLVELPETPRIYTTVLRMDRSTGLTSSHYQFVMAKPYRQRLFARVAAGKHYFEGKSNEQTHR